VSRNAITQAVLCDQLKGNTETRGGNCRHSDAHRISLRDRLNQLQRLVGLLTRASTGTSCLPGLLQWRTARTLGTYSGGAVPASHRLPKHQTRGLYATERASVKRASGQNRRRVREIETRIGRGPNRWTSFLWGIRCPDRWPTHRSGERAASSRTSSRPASMAVVLKLTVPVQRQVCRSARVHRFSDTSRVGVAGTVCGRGVRRCRYGTA
jgi:hypothetical protein